jgi:hypothetical protein
MSRRLTGWVLTAAAIAAGPAPALSSNDLNKNLGQEFQPTVTPVGSMQLLRDGIRYLAGDDTDYTDCLEIMTPREYAVLRGGRVLVLHQPYPTSSANGNLRFDSGMSSDADEQLLGAIDRSKQASSGHATLPWPSIPTGKLLPEGKVQPEHVKAACGIPRGLTLLAPAERELRPAAHVTS